MGTISNVTVTFFHFATSALSSFLTTFLIVFISAVIVIVGIELLFHYLDYKHQVRKVDKATEDKSAK